MNELIRVAVCDDHSVVRAGLRALLLEAADIEVVGEAGSVAEAVDLGRREQTDVFVMDLTLPDGTGIEATAALARVSPRTAVLILTAHDDVAFLRKAFDAGALGYLIKDAADLELVAAVREVAAGRRYVHPRMGAELLAAPPPLWGLPEGPGGRLSERESEVLRLLAEGYTNGQTAEQLHVSVRTVETHRVHIQQKLGVRTRAELTRAARDAGLLDQAH
jgi:two-component system response regulator NreC